MLNSYVMCNDVQKCRLFQGSNAMEVRRQSILLAQKVQCSEGPCIANITATDGACIAF